MNVSLLFHLIILVLLALATANVNWPRFHPGWCAALLWVLLQVVNLG